MYTKKTLFILLLTFITALAHQQAIAQGCAMCRIAPESNLKEGGDIAKNLNIGILFLMAIPYVLLVSAAWYFFRKQINAKLKELGWKKHS